MKTLIVAASAAILAVSGLSGAAEAKPGHGRGHAYGHYKHHKYRAYAPPRGYYAAPRHAYRRSNNAAIAAGVTGAIIGGALSATQPAYRYRAPAYEAPRRYYREDYDYDAW